MIPPEDLELLSIYFDGQLTDEQAQRLNAWVKADPSHARAFAWYSMQQRRTIDCLRRDDLNVTAPWETDADGKLTLDMLEALQDSGEHLALQDLTARFEAKPGPTPRPRHAADRESSQSTGPRVLVIPTWAVAIGVVAAAAAIVFAVTLLMPGQPPSEPTNPDVAASPSDPPAATGEPTGGPTQSPEVTPDVAPVGFARVLDSHKALWLGGSGPVRGQDLLPPGMHRLQQGYIRLGYANGTEVIVQGPATLQVEADNRLLLTDGIASAYVPEAGHGFTISTPAGDVIDVGTEFGVQVAGPQHTEVHVITGEVIAQANAPAQTQGRSLLAGNALLLDGMNPDAAYVQIPLRREKFLRDWQQAGEGVIVDDSARYLFTPPASMQLDQLEHPDEVYVLRERKGLVLQEDLPVNRKYTPGERTSAFGPANEVIKAGTRVDVYIVHFEQAGRGGTQMQRISGRIDFGRPILGLITANDELMATHATLGHPDVTYETKRTIHLEGDKSHRNSEFWDEIIVTRDEQSIGYRLQARENIDEFRIIVEAE